MPQYLIYLNLESYLAQWYIHECGCTNPVYLVRGSAESDILELFLSKNSDNITVDTGAESNVSIVIPYFKNKDVRYFNYLPPFGRKALINTIYTRFRVQLWQELHTVDNIGCSITDLVYAWMEKHGIDPNGKNWETIRQMYFRKRKKYIEQNNNKKSLLLQSE